MPQLVRADPLEAGPRAVIKSFHITDLPAMAE
jgi:hypothetical protein